MESLGQRLNGVAKTNGIPAQRPSQDETPVGAAEYERTFICCSAQPPSSSTTGPANEEITMDVDSGPAIIPASTLSGLDVNKDTNFCCAQQGLRPGDVVADGIMTISQAQTLFNDYARRLDHYLYRILGPAATLDGIRSSSPVLLAAICAVAALHSPDLSSLYESCYHHFVDLAANLALAEDPNMDDIRGLCIGAFWLHKISWNLSSLGQSSPATAYLLCTFEFDPCGP